MRLSSTTLSNLPLLQDHGSTYSSGQTTHNLALYRHSSGALVFGAGTVQWTWGLDSNHDNSSAAADTRMRQATVNLFADMGAQPLTLQPGLAAATKSTDAGGTHLGHRLAVIRRDDPKRGSDDDYGYRQRFQRASLGRGGLD